MKIQPKTPQLPSSEPDKNLGSRWKESAGQALQKAKDAVVGQGNKLRKALRSEQHTSTHHAEEHKAQDLTGSTSKAFDQRYARTNGSLQRTNIMNRPSPVQVSPQRDAGGGGTQHEVQPGETLSGIAAQHNMNWQDLANHNGIENPNHLQVGQNLEIPTPGTPSQPLQPSEPVLPTEPSESTESTSTPGSSNGVAANGLDPAAIHMNQFDGDPNGSNSDCGPTSMAMALQGVGLTPDGADANASTVDTVQAMRQSMYPDDTTQDGVTVNENGETVRDDSEHSQWTTFSALITGAEAAGAEVNQIRPDTGEIAESVQNGNPVVVNGNPGEDGGGWADSYNSGHFITVSGYNPDTETFTINDPLDDAPREVSSEELSNYMEGWSWRALEVSNPNSNTSPAPVSPLSPQPI